MSYRFLFIKFKLKVCETYFIKKSLLRCLCMCASVWCVWVSDKRTPSNVCGCAPLCMYKRRGCRLVGHWQRRRERAGYICLEYRFHKLVVWCCAMWVMKLILLGKYWNCWVGAWFYMRKSVYIGMYYYRYTTLCNWGVPHDIE